MINITNITQSYDSYRQILDQTNAKFEPGKIHLIFGRSGSGKTTLLNCLSGVSSPESGTIHINHIDLHALSENQRADFRLKNIGIIYQFFNLLPSLTVQENILLPASILKHDANQRMRLLSEQFGISSLLSKWPENLSGGECQRVAICRSLICNPTILLADEPTGNLDRTNAQAAFELMNELHVEEGTSLIMVTHDERLAARMDRRLALLDGKLSS